jgi:anti-anti-sigma factor
VLSSRELSSSNESQLSSGWDDESLVIRVAAPLDASGCREFEAELARAERSDANKIILDLDELESLDARMLHVILRASRRSLRNGDRLRVTRGNGHVASIFRLTALDQTLHFDGE